MKSNHLFDLSAATIGWALAVTAADAAAPQQLLQSAETPTITVDASAYLGYLDGTVSSSLAKTILVKADGLTEDITVRTARTGYITLSETTILKDSVMRAEGYNLPIVLEPKDAAFYNDTLYLTSGSASATTTLAWYFIPAPAKVDAADLATVLAATDEAIYTLTTPVVLSYISDSASMMGTKYYTYMLKDAAGDSLKLYDRMHLFNGVEIGSAATRLRFQSTKSYYGGYTYSSLESPELDIEAPVVATIDGFKYLSEDFEGSESSLVDGNDWMNTSTDPATAALLNAESLSYDGYYAPKGKSLMLGGTTSNNCTWFALENDTLYYSALVNITDASALSQGIINISASKNVTASRTCEVDVKKCENGKLSFGIALAGYGTLYRDRMIYTDSIYDLNTTYLIALKCEHLKTRVKPTISLYVNPGTTLVEPAAATLMTDQGKPASMTNCYFNILTGYGNEGVIDGIRVASSWSALMSDEAELRATPIMAATADLSGYISYDPNVEGGNDYVITLEAIHLTEGVSVTTSTPDYITLAADTILKEEAMNKHGYEFHVNLDPKDGSIASSWITFVSSGVTTYMKLTWTYSEPAHLYTVETFADIEANSRGKENAIYTVTGSVGISSITTGMFSSYFDLTDATGITLNCNNSYGVLNGYAEGTHFKNVKIQTQANSSELFIYHSPDLEVIPVDGLANIKAGSVRFDNGTLSIPNCRSIEMFTTDGALIRSTDNGTADCKDLKNKTILIRYKDAEGSHTMKCKF